MDLTWTTAALLGVAAAGVSLGVVGRLIPVLIARRVIDHPNARSSHQSPTPRGGGLGVMAAVLPTLAVAWTLAPPPATAPLTGGWPPGLVLGAGLLMALSLADDIRSLSAPLRLAVHLVAVVLGLACLPPAVLGLGGVVPPVLGAPLAALGWVWMINLTNFMDGIDGITGATTVALGLGLLVLGVVLTLPPAWLLPAPLLAGAALGFLRWNWHPARVFLGDAGSVPLGYLMGALLLLLAGAGQPAAALILALPPIADASLTLGQRLWRGCSPFQAHRDHRYQRAVIAGWSPARVALVYAGAILALLPLALLSLAGPLAALVALILAAGLVGGLLYHLGRLRPTCSGMGTEPGARTGSGHAPPARCDPSSPPEAKGPPQP